MSTDICLAVVSMIFGDRTSYRNYYGHFRALGTDVTIVIIHRCLSLLATQGELSWPPDVTF